MSKVNSENRTPIVGPCHTAGLSIIPDPKDKTKKIAVKVPCARIDGDYCSTYLYPEIKWKTRKCPFAQEEITEEQERMLNPLKASKRAAGKKDK
jgi:hypothetical protein